MFSFRPIFAIKGKECRSHHLFDFKSRLAIVLALALGSRLLFVNFHIVVGHFKQISGLPNIKYKIGDDGMKRRQVVQVTLNSVTVFVLTNIETSITYCWTPLLWTKAPGLFLNPLRWSSMLCDPVCNTVSSDLG